MRTISDPKEWPVPEAQMAHFQQKELPDTQYWIHPGQIVVFSEQSPQWKHSSDWLSAMDSLKGALDRQYSIVNLICAEFAATTTAAMRT